MLSVFQMSNWFTDALFVIGFTIGLYAIITHDMWAAYSGVMLADAALVIAAWRTK